MILFIIWAVGAIFFGLILLVDTNLIEIARHTVGLLYTLFWLLMARK